MTAPKIMSAMGVSTTDSDPGGATPKDQYAARKQRRTKVYETRLNIHIWASAGPAQAMTPA